MNVFLGFLAIIFLLLMFGEKNEHKGRRYTHSFIAVIAGMVALNLIKSLF